jgi:hypothetical protein
MRLQKAFHRTGRERNDEKNAKKKKLDDMIDQILGGGSDCEQGE